MTVLGIISVQEEKISRKPYGRIPVSLKESFDAGIPVIVAEIGITEEELQQRSRWRRTCLEKKATRVLKKNGATVICRDDPVAGQDTLQKKLSQEDMAEAVAYALCYLDDNPIGKTAWFLDRDCDVVDLSLFRQVSQKVQYLGLATENMQRAEMLADELCEEYGVTLTVKPSGFSALGRATLVADMAGGRVRIGRGFLIDGREVTLDLHGYRVDAENLLKVCPELSRNFSHKAWLFGKKRLTR